MKSCPFVDLHQRYGLTKASVSPRPTFSKDTFFPCAPDVHRIFAIAAESCHSLWDIAPECDVLVP